MSADLHKQVIHMSLACRQDQSPGDLCLGKSSRMHTQTNTCVDN